MLRKTTIDIQAVRGRTVEQEEALKQLAKLAQEARRAEDRESVYTTIALAAGFANGIMYAGLIKKNELAQLIDMLNKIGGDRLAELDEKKIHTSFTKLFKGVFL